MCLVDPTSARGMAAVMRWIAGKMYRRRLVPRIEEEELRLIEGEAVEAVEVVTFV